MGKMFTGATDAYMKGAEFTRAGEKHQMGSEEHGVNMKKAGIQTEMLGIQNEEARANMADKNRQIAFKTARPGGAASGPTREETAWQNEMIDQPALAKKLAESQIAGASVSGQLGKQQLADTKEAAAKRKLDDLATELATNPAAQQDPNAAMAIGAKYGVTDPGAIKLASLKGAQLAASGQATKNVTYGSTLPGKLAGEKIVGLDSKFEAARQLKEAADAFNKSGAFSSNATASMSKAQKAMQGLNDTTEISSGVGGFMLDTDAGMGVRTRGEQLQMAVDRARGNLKEELDMLKATAGPEASPEVQQKIAQYESLLMQLNTRNINLHRTHPQGVGPIKNASMQKPPANAPGVSRGRGP